MDQILSAAVIGATATIIGALIGRAGFLEDILRNRPHPKLQREWLSLWLDIKDPSKTEHRELLFITKQQGSRLKGYIIIEKTPIKDGI